MTASSRSSRVNVMEVSVAMRLQDHGPTYCVRITARRFRVTVEAASRLARGRDAKPSSGDTDASNGSLVRNNSEPQIHHRRREDHRIDDVEHPAEARHGLRRVLLLRVALDQRFGQIAEH